MIVYNSSAGSGKTFSITKKYLEIILSNQNNQSYKNILAITFTNNSAKEMKDRILCELFDISQGKSSDILDQISSSKKIEKHILIKNSKQLLNDMLNDYSNINISTIDSFYNKVIRPFSTELDLSFNYNTESSPNYIIDDAIRNFLSKLNIKKDKKFISYIFNYISSKIDQGNIWDIEKELKKISYSIYNETNYSKYMKLSEIPLKTFSSIKEMLKETLKNHILIINKCIDKINKFIRENNINNNIFYSHSIDKLLSKNNNINEIIEKIAKNKTIKTKIEEGKLFNKKSNLDEFKQEYISDKLCLMHKSIIEYEYNKIIINSLTPMAVIEKIFKEINAIKDNQNITFISDFGYIISKHIKELPVPYIYEKIGERFKYYFFDEFQDTSNIQWQNFQPLIENAIANNGNAVLVGDPKQSIYRWRAANIDIFNNIITDDKNEINSLKKNYRSSKTIVEFVNSMVTNLSNHLAEEYKQIFKSSLQNPNIEEPGFVNIEFIEESQNTENDYNEKIYQTIQDLLSKNFKLNDIAILTRKKDSSKKIAMYLSEKNIDTILSDSCTLTNCSNIKFILSILKIIINPEDYNSKKYLLCFIANKFKIKDTHTFISQNIKENINTILSDLKKYNIYTKTIKGSFLYDIVENIIKSFDLEISSHLLRFIDEINEFTLANKSNIYDFLKHWEIHNEKIQINIPHNINAVKIMTIHKAKGLEFPVVILPMFDWRENNKTQIWVDFEYKSYSIPLKINLNETTRQIHEKKSKKEENLKMLDIVNLIYVSITRAKQRLYITCPKKTNKYGKTKPNGVSKYFENYFDENNPYYSLGDELILNTTDSNQSQIQKEFNLTMGTKRIHQIITPKRDEKVSYDNSFHKIMKKIISKEDIDNALNIAVRDQDIAIEQKKIYKELILKLVNHPKIKKYYDKNITVKNEIEILNKDGSISRPDRVCIMKNDIHVIIDYKTGSVKKKYIQQLESYEQDILSIGAKKVIKNLIYVNFKTSDINVYLV